MSTPFQNRLVGTIIVAAAAIIFLPDIFDGEKEAYQAQFESVPPAPQTVEQQNIKAFPDKTFNKLKEEPPLVDDKADDESLKSVPQTSLDKAAAPVKAHHVDTKKTTSITDSETKVASKPKPVAVKPAPKKQQAVIKPVPKSVDKSISYVIQLGSFRHKKNVEQLVAKLKKHGYTVYTKPIKTSAGNLTKVFIGPAVSESALQKMLPTLKSITGVQGRVSIYQPVDK